MLKMGSGCRLRREISLPSKFELEGGECLGGMGIGRSLFAMENIQVYTMQYQRPMNMEFNGQWKRVLKRFVLSR